MHQIQIDQVEYTYNFMEIFCIFKMNSAPSTQIDGVI